MVCVCGVWCRCVVCGLWLWSLWFVVVCGWFVVCGVWYVCVCGVWCVVCCGVCCLSRACMCICGSSRGACGSTCNSPTRLEWRRGVHLNACRPVLAGDVAQGVLPSNSATWRRNADPQRLQSCHCLQCCRGVLPSTAAIHSDLQQSSQHCRAKRRQACRCWRRCPRAAGSTA